MTTVERYQAFIHYFAHHAPNPTTELHYSNPFELLVAVILSAQCLDKRVNQVTPHLFAHYPTPQSLANASETEILTHIRTITYPKSKARHLKKMAQRLIRDFQATIPSTREALIQLEGVGRKTANIILAEVYHQPTLGVDTHVMRVSKRIGLVDPKSSTPLAIERQLLHYLPKKYHRIAHHWLVLHGRYICLARRPKCDTCPLTQFCHYYQNHPKPHS